jgi:hypothetical protein
MSIDVVVYAEGEGELASGLESEFELPIEPGRSIPEERLGPAHRLVRRAIAHVSDVPGAAVSFQQHKRFEGRQPKGSDLRRAEALKQLLNYDELYADRPPVPELAVLLIDQDGEAGRRQSLEETVERVRTGAEPTRCIAVAVQEFEAWLVADVGTIQYVLGEETVDATENPEALEPGEAKRTFQDWGLDTPSTRCDVVERVELDEIARRCDAFEAFLSDIDRFTSNLD